MELFRTLAGLLPQGVSATLVVRPSAGGKMTVITNFTTEKGGVCDSLAPFTLKGTPEEMDGGFLEAIAVPAKTVSGLISNIEAFQKSAQQAEKNAKTSSAKPSTASSVSAAAKKAEEERKRREAEAKCRKENFDKALAEAKVANARGNYYTAEALMNFAATLTDDKKVKADLAKQVKLIEPNKGGFLCSDDDAAATAALEAFKASMAVPSADAEPKAEAAAGTQPAQDADGEPEEAPECETEEQGEGE